MLLSSTRIIFAVAWYGDAQGCSDTLRHCGLQSGPRVGRLCIIMRLLQVVGPSLAIAHMICL